MVVNRIIENLILPPGGLVLLLFVGLLVARRWRRLSQVMVWSGVVGFYAVSSPFLASQAMRILEVYPPLDMAMVPDSGARAIVVLSGNRYSGALEYGRDTIGGTTLQRLRYGAYVHRQTGLPLLVAGGTVVDKHVDTLAGMMANVLAEEFGIDEAWLEPRSRNTWENAKFSQAILAEKGVDAVILVTHASHMMRAVEAFEHAGLKVLPAPTVYEAGDYNGGRSWFDTWLPSSEAMQMSAAAAHEVVGLLWYRLRYY